MKKTTLQTVVAIAISGMVVTTNTQAQSNTPIKIGFSTEITGPWTYFGTSCVAGLKMGVEDVNKAGGVLKRPLEFIIKDNQTNPSQALAAARDMNINDKVLALSGTTNSDVALALYGYSEQEKIAHLIPVAAFPQLTKPGTKYNFRIEPDAVGWGYAMVKFIEQKKPGAKVAIMHSDAALMRAISSGFKYQAKLSKLDLVADITFPQGSSDATIQAAQVKAANPDFVIVNGAGAFDNVITNQLLDLGFRPNQLIHPYGITSQIFGWGKRSVGSYYGTFFDKGLLSLTPEGKTFISRFDEAQQRPPSYVENYCYNTPFIIKKAIEAAGTADSREKFRNALSMLKGLELTSGVPIEFDKNGARKEYMYFMEITDVKEKRTYESKQQFYIEWDPEVIPVYEIVK